MAVFRETLRQAGINRPDERVLNRISSSYSSSMITCCRSVDLACDLYRRVKDLPETFTRLCFSKDLEIEVNGDASLDNPNLLSAVDAEGVPLVIKVLRTKGDNLSLTEADRLKEVTREKESCDILNLAHPEVAFVTTSLVSVNHTMGITLHALRMPRYPTTVALSPHFPIAVLVREGARMIDTVQYMHDRGLVHMDIKGANIFCDMNGHWFLGDFGSCCRINELVTSSTTFFCKEDVRRKPAMLEYDWFMLLVTLLIESLDDKHEWTVHLKHDTENHVCVNKLRSLIQRKLENRPLAEILMDIIGRLGEYFTL